MTALLCRIYRSSVQGTTLAEHLYLMRERIDFPSGQYVDKNNCTLRVRDGKEWERTGKPRFLLGGCNFRKGNNLGFCRESNSQCGGQEFDPPLLHQLIQQVTARRSSPFLFPLPIRCQTLQISRQRQAFLRHLSGL